MSSTPGEHCGLVADDADDRPSIRAKPHVIGSWPSGGCTSKYSPSSTTASMTRFMS